MDVWGKRLVTISDRLLCLCLLLVGFPALQYLRIDPMTVLRNVAILLFNQLQLNHWIWYWKKYWSYEAILVVTLPCEPVKLMIQKSTTKICEVKVQLVQYATLHTLVCFVAFQCSTLPFFNCSHKKKSLACLNVLQITFNSLLNGLGVI